MLAQQLQSQLVQSKLKDDQKMAMVFHNTLAKSYNSDVVETLNEVLEQMRESKISI